jgi:aspartyl-tRNA(Asn)/glutamyl-tRNA(Gln) amidotransferase subunit A
MNNIKIFVEDSIMQKDKPVTAGSKILGDFKSPFDATVVERLNVAGLKIEKTLAMDEFGIDSLFTDDDGILPAVSEAAADEKVCVLCNDTFGKVRRQAALNGVSYIRPTYGTVSRYGLIPQASSMDQIGIACTDPRKGFEILEIIAGKDEKDGAMWLDGSFDEFSRGGGPADKIKVAIPDNAWNKNDASVTFGLEHAFDLCHINLDYFEVYHQLLYILSSAEICNNTNRYDGIKFGHRSENSRNLKELYFNTRSEGFTMNTKLAIIMGAGVLSKDNYARFYEKAMKIRRLIKESLTFDGYDIIALPIKNDKSKYEQSALFALTALAGLPSLTIPCGNSGVQFIANARREDVLISLL